MSDTDSTKKTDSPQADEATEQPTQPEVEAPAQDDPPAAEPPAAEEPVPAEASDNEPEDKEPEEPPLDVKLTVVSEVERRVEVVLPWADVAAKQDEAYRELGKGVTIKGFRRGKVPRRMLQQMFGKHIGKEVTQLLVQESIDKAIKQVDIQAVGEPRLELPEEGLVKGQDFKYAAVLEVIPPLTITDYEGVEVTGYHEPVSDEDVDSLLRTKQRELTDYKAVEGRETREGDVLLLDIMGKLGDEPIAYEGRSVELGPSGPDLVPGLKAALTGKTFEEEDLDLELDVPAEGDRPATKARLLVTIHDVKEKVIPELDDELAKDTGLAETLEELRQVLRKEQQEKQEEQAREKARHDLVKEVVKRNKVPVPPALVERYTEQRLQLQRMLSGQPHDQPGPQDEALKEALRPEALEVVQSGMVLEALGKQEKLEVSDEELDAELNKMAESRGQNLARVKSEYEKEGRIDSLRRRLMEDKALDLLASKGKITIEERTEITEETADKGTPEGDPEPAE